MGGNPRFPCSQYRGTAGAARESEHNRGPVSSPHVPSSKGQWQADQQAEQAEKPFPPAGMGRTSQSRTALPQSSSVPTLLQGLGQKLLQGVLCTCVTANSIDLRETRRMCSCLGSLQLFPPCKGIILVQNTAGDLPAAFWGLGWGGEHLWLTISSNTLISSSMWNEIKCTPHRNLLQAFLCSTIYTKLKLLWMVMVILNNSETKVNQNSTVNILKLHLTCSYNKISKHSPSALKYC